MLDFKDLILKTRNKEALTTEEIAFLVKGMTNGQLEDCQAAAWAMAVYFQGLSPRELKDLTWAMAHSGEVIGIEDLPVKVIDKHSTGGVGDKISLVVISLVAASGLAMLKMSGRGLGHTGGTIDKLEAIPGFRVELGQNEILTQVKAINGVIVSQSDKLVPADKRLYAIRDVTATIDSIPLIAASIMSKKIACGAQTLVLDVKTGSGAFMKKEAEALELAQIMVQIGKDVGLKVAALISDMDQPLGRMVGNALEVKEALDTLRGGGPPDIVELSLCLSAYLMWLAGQYENVEASYKRAQYLLHSGAGLKKFMEMIQWQGGHIDLNDEHYSLPRARFQQEITSDQEGYIQSIDAKQVGLISMLLGAGRARAGDAIDHGAGLELVQKRGDYVYKGQTIAFIHGNCLGLIRQAQEQLLSAYRMGSLPPDRKELILQVVL